MDKLNGLLPKIAVGLAIPAAIGLVVMYGTQIGLARDVDSAGTKAKECCMKAHSNETSIAVISAKLDAFQAQYDKDQKDAKEQRQAILDAVKEKK